MNKVCVVTSTRADYGLLRPLVFKLLSDHEVDLRVVATGSHISATYGMTVREIEQDNIVLNAVIPILCMDPEDISVAQTMAEAISKFSSYFSTNRPDILVVLGDRYEILAVCCAAIINHIPIAHIHGGEITEGALDDCFRHCITKMSVLHFTACETYRKRVIQLGEHPDRVFNVGALGVENALNVKLKSIEELSDELAFDFGSSYILLTFHPVTQEVSTESDQFSQILKALDQFPELQVVITKSNADKGGSEINKLIDSYVKTRSNCKAYFSLGMLRYLSVLKYAKCVVGNSSSGIIEAPALHVPTVNIGDRQRGRLKADSIIDCQPICEEIVCAIQAILSGKCSEMVNWNRNPYGNGDTSSQIAKKIKQFLQYGDINLKKQFYDLNF